MAQYIKNANLFGRIGTGIGKGLAEQVPKEIERSRLAAGLKEVGQKKGLDTFQQFAELASVPGISPQAIQSGTDLLRQRAQQQAYGNASGAPRASSAPASQGIRDVQFANLNPNQQQQSPASGQVNNQQRTSNVASNQDIPQVAEGNALNQQNLTRPPWTPQQRNASIASYIDQGFLPDQAKQLQQDDETRDLGEPEAYKQRLGDIESAKSKVRDSLTRHLQTKLQKTGEGVYKDVEGKMLLNAERGMTRDLILNPKADIDNVANDWSERLYNTAIAKGKLRTLGQTTGTESLFKGDTNEKKLNEYQKIFKRSGNLEEFKNILQGADIGLSAPAAASKAYPPNPKISKKISDYRSSSGLQFNAPQKTQEAKKMAIEIEDDIGQDDSILAIVRNLSDKDPYFDQQAFIDQISEDQDEIGLNERQRIELAEGVGNILPNWADLLYLPIMRR